jgi:asparagine synthase (glutamine-hydrolysing)
MCGICGTFALTGELAPEIAGSLRPMTTALSHRGPDGEGFFTDRHAALGHRRRAIIDREGGKQPMSNEDGSCWIVFNGEVYNHHEIRHQLVGKGHTFRTHSDTEAIVHAYEEYGPACVDHLEGMFAFAIYDQRRRELFIARDRLGKKPLFYAALGGALHFASEIKAIRESPAWDGALDLEGLEGYLSLGYFLAPRTVYQHVHALEPGHWLRVRNGSIETRQYWDVPAFDDFGLDEVSAVEQVDSQLHARVRERLESEVPLGAFLSGGIDSGLVVSYMAGDSRDRVVTTSVGFGERAHNELDAAAVTATRFQTEHYPHLIQPALEDVFEKLVDGFDQPFADASALPTYYVSQAARQHVTVALSGDGGDETFGGYDFRYVPHAVEANIRRRVPGSLRGTLRFVGARWPRSRHLPRSLRLGTYIENVGRSGEEAYYADLCFLKPQNARDLLGLSIGRDPKDSPVYEAVTGPYRRCPSTSAVQKAQYADLKVYLPNDVLTKVDRMSMQNSLEVRCPLLDRRLVELAFRMPESLKLPGLRAKHLLKEVAARRLPAELLTLPKRGFTAPLGEWIAGKYAKQFEAEVLRSGSAVEGLLDVQRVRRTFNAHVTGQVDAGYALWAIWMLERWSARQSVPALRDAVARTRSTVVHDAIA